jgi:thioredoxin 1
VEAQLKSHNRQRLNRRCFLWENQFATRAVAGLLLRLRSPDMETVKLSTENDFQNTIMDGVALIDFNAPWCAPCRFQQPILKKLARQYEGRAIITEINVDENRQTAIRFGIQSIPTLILFKNGNEIRRFIGLQSGKALSRAIEKVLD